MKPSGHQYESLLVNHINSNFFGRSCEAFADVDLVV